TATARSSAANSATSASVAPKPVRLRRCRAPSYPIPAAWAARHSKDTRAAAIRRMAWRIALLAAAGVALVRRLHLLGRDEAVAVGVDLAEVLRQARRVGLRLGEAHP